MSSDQRPYMLATFGYAGGLELAKLHKAVTALDALIVDVRFTARGANKLWNRDSLVAVFGRQHYHHLWTLGNRNYKHAELPVDIVDIERGRVMLETFFKRTHVIMLMCACSSAEHCHRRRVTDYMQRNLTLSAPVTVKDFSQHDINEIAAYAEYVAS